MGYLMTAGFSFFLCSSARDLDAYLFVNVLNIGNLDIKALDTFNLKIQKITLILYSPSFPHNFLFGLALFLEPCLFLFYSS